MRVDWDYVKEISSRLRFPCRHEKQYKKTFVLGLGRWYSDQSTCHTSGGIRILILLIPQTVGEGSVIRFRGQTLHVLQSRNLQGSGGPLSRVKEAMNDRWGGDCWAGP